MKSAVLLCSSAEGNQGKTKYARVVELVDSLDSGSSVHCGRAGSSPASRTKETVERLSLFSLSKNFQYAPVSGIIKETGVFLWNNGEKTQEVKQLLWI